MAEGWPPTVLGATLLCDAEIFVDTERGVGDLGAGPWGGHQAHYIRDGWFKGPRLSGRVLPGGGDWPRIGADGTQRLDVRAVWRSDDGALLSVGYAGRIAAAPEVWAEMAEAGPAAVDPARYYFRSAPMFETAHPAYQWLNRIVAVAQGRAIAGGIAYRVWAID